MNSNPLSVVQILSLASFSLLMAIGQLLFKYGALKSIDSQLGPKPLSLIQQPAIISGLLLYAFATLLWLRLLQIVPLNRAYPFTALSLVFVPICSRMLFQEQINMQHAVGMLFVIGGILIIGFSK